MQNKEKTVLISKIFRINVLLNCHTCTLQRFSALQYLSIEIIKSLKYSIRIGTRF